MPSLTAEGLIVERADEIRDSILDDLETYEGVGTIDRTRLDQRVDGQYASIMAERLDDLGQALVAVRDARSPNNATGRQLDDLAEITGTFREPATYSRCAVTITGTAGTVVPKGKIVGNSVTGDRWVLVDSVTIPGGGSVAGVVQAEAPGTVNASVGQLTKIVTGVTGWTSVTNAGLPTVGQERESDAALRVRRLQELPRPGGGYIGAIRAGLIALDAVTSAVVIANNKITTQTVQGVSLPGASLAVYIWPDTLTDAEKAEVAEVLWTKAPAGTEQVGTESATVTDAGGGTQTVKWNWATEVALTAAEITVALRSGYVLDDVEEAIREIVADYFEGLIVGATVSVLDLSYLIRDTVPGIASLSFTFDDGGGPAAGDYVPAVTEIVTLDDSNLTVTT